jgi:hypothetical protein
MKSMAIPILSHIKLSSQLLIEENYLLRNILECSCKGKYGHSSDHMNSHFCINPMIRSISIIMLSLLGIGILITLSLSAYAQDPLVKENE